MTPPLKSSRRRFLADLRALGVGATLWLAFGCGVSKRNEELAAGFDPAHRDGVPDQVATLDPHRDAGLIGGVAAAQHIGQRHDSAESEGQNDEQAHSGIIHRRSRQTNRAHPG